MEWPQISLTLRFPAVQSEAPEIKFTTAMTEAGVSAAWLVIKAASRRVVGWKPGKEKLGRDVNESSGCLWARLFCFAGAAGQQLGCDYAFCLFCLVSPQWKIALLLLILYLVHFNLVWHHLKLKWENESELSAHFRLFKNSFSKCFQAEETSDLLYHYNITRAQVYDLL